MVDGEYSHLMHTILMTVWQLHFFLPLFISFILFHFYISHLSYLIISYHIIFNRKAPFFAKDADHVPIETQMVLAEIDPSKTVQIVDLLSPLRRSNEKSNKKDPVVYSILMPLIDYEKGFRMTLFGGNEGT